MTRVLISNPLQRDFSMVPDALWRSDLSFAAKGVACYLLSLRNRAMPYVAEIESMLGIGRDARRKAFAELEAAGFLKWVVVRDASNRIVTRTLELDPFSFDLAERSEGLVPRPTESQADGEKGACSSRAPEKPSGGKPAPAAAANRSCRDEKSGALLRERKEKSAAAARACVRKPLAAARSSGGYGMPDVSGLTQFQRSRILSGHSLTLDGGATLIEPGSPEAEALCLALRSQEAGNGQRHA
ncbi:hypothetical protein [uncultured Jannaschia sp.]|uniref:hypothetical protein n=1 Tax=uncultured Jannaschia sp. TaxID=293347 RepID=UPI0026045A1C|nr:hypothetical protein [uncultured Jannaschia sp.]